MHALREIADGPSIQLNLAREAAAHGICASQVLFVVMDALEGDIGAEVELTYAEIVAVLGYNHGTVSKAVNKLLDNNILLRKRYGQGGPFHYRLNADLGHKLAE